MKLPGAAACFCFIGTVAAFAAPPEFAVASIRPSAQSVQFESDGTTEITPGALTMRDVTVATCIKFAYEVQDSQIVGPGWLDSEHFDILAKADSPAAADQMKLMMRNLLADRFGLTFHRENREMRAYAMTAVKGGAKLHESAADTVTSRQNSAIGTVAKGITMKEFADFISGPLQRPVVDATGLRGKYDFDLNFAAYIPQGETVMKTDYDNTIGIIIAALQGELGLKLESEKLTVEVMSIDRVERPSAN